MFSFLLDLFQIFFSLLFLVTVQGAPTIIVSSDGFRWDYYGRIETPGIDKIIEKGVHVKNLKNSFATVTFPNHYSLVTGKYEESHGIVDNSMYDPDLDATFDMSTVDPVWWSEGEPVWVTASKLGIKSVCVNWVGCAIEGQRPTFWNEFNGSIPYEERIDRIVDRMQEAHLGLLYFEEPDHSCHEFGPDSPEVDEAIRRVDNAILALLDKVDLNEVNVIFTSDHGGIGVDAERIVVLKDHSTYQFSLAASGAVAHVWPINLEETDSLLSDLNESISKSEATCFAKNAIPNRLHYSNNPRIAPIVCIAELGWSLVETTEEKNDFTLKGSHGYDASRDGNSPMRPIFVAGGPGIKERRNVILAPFENVHVFPLVATLIGIPEASFPQMNGTLHEIRHLLNGESVPDSQTVVLQW